MSMSWFTRFGTGFLGICLQVLSAEQGRFGVFMHLWPSGAKIIMFMRGPSCSHMDVEDSQWGL